MAGKERNSTHRVRKAVAAASGFVSAVRRRVSALRARLPARVKRVIRRVTHVSLHSVLGVLLAIALLFALAYLWLPTLSDRKGEIESLLSSQIGIPVTFERLDTFWDGLNPGIRVQGARLAGATSTDEASLHLRELRLSLAWRPLLTGRIRIGNLTLVEPEIIVERLADGSYRLGGLGRTRSSERPMTDLAEWLLVQHEIAVENATVIWRDHRQAKTTDAPETMKIAGLSAALVNRGSYHRIEVRAGFPETLCRECRLSAEIEGNPVVDADWKGNARLVARGLSVQGLPVVARERLPSGFDGKFDLDLESLWQDRRPVSIEGRVAVAGLKLPVTNMSAPLELKSASARVYWRGRADTWQLDLNRLQLGLTRAAWPAGRVQVERSPDRLKLKVERIEIDDLVRFAVSLPQDDRFFTWLRAARPEGQASNLTLEMKSGPVPADFRVTADLSKIAFAAHESIPGLTGLAGRVSMSRHDGEFRLVSTNLRTDLPHVFRTPIDVTRASGSIRWRVTPESWKIVSDDLAAESEDGRVHGDLDLDIPRDPARSPVMKLHADIRDGQGAHAARYLPNVMPEGLRSYLTRAIVAGRVTQGSVLFDGALRDFPFRHGEGRFEVQARVAGAVFEYLPRWEPLRDVNADLYFTGTGMRIALIDGRMHGMNAGRAVIAIEDFLAPGGAVVTVNGRIAGAANNLIDGLEAIPDPRYNAWLPRGVRADGNGVFTLALNIPVKRPAETTFDGHYRFLGSSVELPFRAIRVDNIRGALTFGHKGLEGGSLRASLLGSEATLEAATGADGVTRIDARGTLTEVGLSRAIWSGLSVFLRGDAPWQTQILFAPKGMAVRFESDLSNLELRLPAPLAKQRGEPLTLALASLPGNGTESLVFDLRAADRLSGRLGFQRHGAGWKFARGRIGIGEAVTGLPAASGLTLGAHLAALDADRWWPLLRPGLNDRNTSGWLDVMTRISAEVAELDAFGRRFGRFNLDLTKFPGRWQGHVDGDAITGEAVVTEPGCDVAGRCAPPGELNTDQDRPGIHLTLEKLLLPEARAEQSGAITDPRSLPVLNVKSNVFRMADRDLGMLDFSAAPVPQGWRISKVELKTENATYTANGWWEIDRQKRQTSRFSLAGESRDFSETLGTLGFHDELAGGQLNFSSRWSWPGAPADFRLGRVQGQATLSISKGRLLKIEPGAGRLLGVLDLRALTRYLTLDFSSVFGKGLAFDTLKGTVQVESGNAWTRDLAIRMPGANLDMDGRFGFVAHDLDLEIGVTPRVVSDLVVPSTILGGPAVGAVVLAIETIIKKPFEKNTRIRYTVNGSWDDPKVTRIGPPVTVPQDETANP